MLSITGRNYSVSGCIVYTMVVNGQFATDFREHGQRNA